MINLDIFKPVGDLLNDINLSGREEILAIQEAEQAVQDEAELEEKKLLAQDDYMDMTGAGGPDDDR